MIAKILKLCVLHILKAKEEGIRQISTHTNKQNGYMDLFWASVNWSSKEVQPFKQVLV